MEKKDKGVVTVGMIATVVSIVGPLVGAAWVFNSKIDTLGENVHENHVEVVQRLSVVETEVKGIKDRVEKLDK